MHEHDSISCREVYDRIDDFLDQELAEDERALVREHLGACVHCQDEVARETTLLECLKRCVQKIDVPDDLKSRVLQALNNREES